MKLKKKVNLVKITFAHPIKSRFSVLEITRERFSPGSQGNIANSGHDCRSKRRQSKEYAKKYGFNKVTNDGSSVFVDPSVDAVLIATRIILMHG